MAGEAVYICLRVLKESNKSRFHSYSVRNSVLNISHIAFRDCRVHIFPTTFLEIVVNTLARSGGPTRPRRDNQSMRECCSQLHLFSHINARESENFSPHKQKREALNWGTENLAEYQLSVVNFHTFRFRLRLQQALVYLVLRKVQSSTLLFWWQNWALRLVFPDHLNQVQHLVKSPPDLQHLFIKKRRKEKTK